MKWSVGITTCTQRLHDLLPRTVDSLQSAGFSIDRMFVDGNCHAELDLPVTVRVPAVGCYANWHLSLLELFYRNQEADRFAIFQDDCIAVSGLREYLESHPLPERGWWNILTHTQNEHIAHKSNATGWFVSNQNGMGAVGLVFDRDALLALLGSRVMLDRSIDPTAPAVCPQYVDGSIARTLAAAGFTEYCHVPSLLQHTGAQSSVKSGRQWRSQVSQTFPGEDWDARKFPAA